VRSIYSRALLAYYDATGDERIPGFLERAYQNYTAAQSSCTRTPICNQTHQGSRSMTQMEVLLEMHAFGGPMWMRDLALQLMGPAAGNRGYAFMQRLLLPECVNANASAIAAGQCMQHAHGVTYNEVAKLFAMGSSWSGNASHLLASETAFSLLEQFDMQPFGVNSGRPWHRIGCCSPAHSTRARTRAHIAVCFVFGLYSISGYSVLKPPFSSARGLDGRISYSIYRMLPLAICYL